MWCSRLFVVLSSTYLVFRSFGPVEAVLLQDDPRCIPGEYWCQDRCGSDSYGQTCCETPNSQHNLCGAGTICCLDGCCPSDSTCNEVGACMRTITTTGSGGQSTTFITTVLPTDTGTQIPTSTQPATGVTSLPDSATATNTESPTPPISTGENSGTGSPSPSSATVYTTTLPDGQTVTITESGTETIPSVTTPSPTSDNGQTTIPGSSTPGATTEVSDTLTIVSPTSEQGSGTTTVPSSEGDNTGTGTVTPPGTSPSSDGGNTGTETTTLPGTTPSSEGGNTGTGTTTLPGTIPSSEGSTTIPGTGTATIPNTTPLSTLTTPGDTPTSLPPSQTETSAQETSQVDTFVSPSPDTSTTVLPPDTTVSPSDTATPTSQQVSSVETPPTSEASGGSTTIPDTGVVSTPPATTQTTPVVVTSDGVTSTPLSTTGQPDQTSTGVAGPLTTFTAWPPLVITPVTTSVSEPKPTDDGTVVPCNLWFFFVCISWQGINVGGWVWPLPPGVYPPGPPPGLELPPGFSISGSLPPWPQITIGNNRLPTYSDKPTSCEPQTATVWAYTTSYGVSVSDGSTVTTATQVQSTPNSYEACSKIGDDTTQTTTGACQTATVTDVWVSCAPSQSSDCTTTSTSVLTGCDVTATTIRCSRTSTAQATPTAGAGVAVRQNPGEDVCVVQGGTEYVIYPSDSDNKEQCDAITAKLKTMVDPSQIVTVEMTCCGVVYWTAPLNSDQANELSEDDTVMSVFAQCSDDCENPFDPTAELVMQPNSPDSLVFVDQFGGVDQQNPQPLSWYRSNYVYEESAGEGIDVYVVDSGADMNHPEFNKGSKPASRHRFLQTPRAKQKMPNPGDFSGHGTSMLSQITGATVGLAKKVNPVVVQIFITGGETELLAGLTEVLNDVTARQPKQAVVSMSLHYPTLQDATGTSKQCAMLLKKLVALGVSPITGSGNDFKTTIEGIPAILAVDTPPTQPHENYVPELLVAGAVNSAGERWPKSNRYDQYGLPTHYAPGWDIVSGSIASIDPAGSGLASGRSGTSLATAQTAGLAAYLLALGQKPIDDPYFLPADVSTPAALKAYILELSWARVAPYNAIYNGLRPSDMSLDGPNCPIVQRRDAPESALPDWPDCSNVTSPTSSPTPSTFVTSIVSITPTGTEEASTSSMPPLPTLTPTPSPTDSSCLYTATFTTCVFPGVGHGQVCQVTSGCGSWVPKTTAPPPETTTPPATPTSAEASPTTAAGPTFTPNPPPDKTDCISDADCDKYTCDDGSKSTCQLAAGDPFTHWCVCGTGE